MCDINVSDIESQKDLNERVKIGSFFGTLQAGFTDFHYLRPIWRKTTEEEALIGVGMTGIASGKVLNYNLEESSNIVKDENERIANIIGINKASRTTTVKPSGTSSLVLGTSSGIHAWHANYYLRRQKLLKTEAIYTYLTINHPELLEDDFFRPHTEAWIVVPQKAPDNAITRQESALELLQRVKDISLDWVKKGHRKGDNTNNISATITITKDEWESVGEWMWKNNDIYNGLAVLPKDLGTYVQTPFEDCTKEKYEKLSESLRKVDLTKVIEINDETNHSQESACSGSKCEL